MLVHRLIFLIRRYIRSNFFSLLIAALGLTFLSAGHARPFDRLRVTGSLTTKAQATLAAVQQQDTLFYPFLNYKMNYLQFWKRDALSSFYGKWKETGVKKLSIVHFGDSHVQADILP